MTTEDDLTIQAKRLIAERLAYGPARTVMSLDVANSVAEAVEALFDAKIAVMLDQLSERIEQKFGARP